MSQGVDDEDALGQDFKKSDLLFNMYFSKNEMQKVTESQNSDPFSLILETRKEASLPQTSTLIKILEEEKAGDKLKKKLKTQLLTHLVNPVEEENSSEDDSDDMSFRSLTPSERKLVEEDICIEEI